MKRFLLFSLSVAILCACGFGGFVLWKHDRAEKETIVALKEKRARLDDYYYWDFRINYLYILDDQYKSDPIRITAFQWNEEAVGNMIKDGYDRAEIENIRSKGRDKAEESIEFRKIRKTS